MDWPDKHRHIYAWMDHDRTFTQADPAGFFIERFGRAASNAGSINAIELLE